MFYRKVLHTTISMQDQALHSSKLTSSRDAEVDALNPPPASWFFRLRLHHFTHDDDVGFPFTDPDPSSGDGDLERSDRPSAVVESSLDLAPSSSSEKGDAGREGNPLARRRRAALRHRMRACMRGEPSFRVMYL